MEEGRKKYWKSEGMRGSEGKIAHPRRSEGKLRIQGGGDGRMRGDEEGKIRGRCWMVKKIQESEGK